MSTMTQVHNLYNLRHPWLDRGEQREDRRQRKLERKCFFTRPLGHRWDHPYGDKRAFYDNHVEGPAIDTTRTCQDCGRREKHIPPSPSSADYRWCRLNAWQF